MTRKPKSRARLTHLSVLTNSVMAPALRHRGGVMVQLLQLWPEISTDMAGWSLPVNVRFPAGRREGGVLTLSVAAARGPEAQARADALMRRANAALGYGAIARISIRQDYSLTEKKLQQPTAEPAEDTGGSDSALLLRLERATRTIHSPELRAALIRLGRVLEQQKK
ncbi:MAG: DUF721 domain-containing protein [Alphaproteobacteria bacterium]|jgi:hypothetical protein|nr:DUF721 domain-containing protein [Alphaproteobacteria bacterium]